MKKIILILIISVFVLTGCSSSKTMNQEYFSFVDSNDTKITLIEKPKNVAILFSSFVEMYSIAGGKINITVQESIDRDLVSNDVILVDGGAGKTINLELLVASKPDFVIGSLDIASQVKTCTFLNEIGIPSALFKVETFDDYLKVFSILTSITNNKDSYQKNGIEVKDKIDSLLQNIKKEKNINILFIRTGSTSGSCKAKNKDSHFVCKMLDELGTYNIADKSPLLLDGLSIEEIIINDPDYIFISIMGNEDSGKKFITELFNDGIYRNLSAIKNEKFYILPKNLFQYKPNQNWDKAYKYLVDILYE